MKNELKKNVEVSSYRLPKWILVSYGIVNEVKDGIVVVKEGLPEVGMSEIVIFESTGMKGIINFLGKEKIWEYCNYANFSKNILDEKIVDSYIDNLKIIVNSLNDTSKFEGLISARYYKKYKRLNGELLKYEGKVVNYEFEKEVLEDCIVMCIVAIKRLELRIIDINNSVEKKKIRKLEKELTLEKKYLNKYKIKLEKIEKLYFKFKSKWEDCKIQMQNFEKIINITNLRILKESFRKIFILYLQGGKLRLYFCIKNIKY